MRISRSWESEIYTTFVMPIGHLETRVCERLGSYHLCKINAILLPAKRLGERVPSREIKVCRYFLHCTKHGSTWVTNNKILHLQRFAWPHCHSQFIPKAPICLVYKSHRQEIALGTLFWQICLGCEKPLRVIHPDTTNVQSLATY